MDGTVFAKVINLGSFSSIRSCAKELLKEETRLDRLILNAGEPG